MAAAEPEYVVDFPTIGFLGADWIEWHCPIPDGFRKGDPFEMYDWQLWCTVNHYRVRSTAKTGQLAPAFFNRRSQVIAPQKTGKGPWSAAIICLEARGPAVFAGWAKRGDAYDCGDFGCDCGWGYEYEPGEPMGRPWPTPLIQLLATAVEQVDNVYRPLQAMVKGGPLGATMKVGEEFIRLPSDGRIDVVTSSASARLGNPITFALQDETGLYTPANRMVRVAETQRRGLAGMGGRSIETTNPPDPNEGSVAQRTFESKRPDIFKFYRPPPAHLSYSNKSERAKIHRYVYAGSPHVDLDSIEAEAAELLEVDPPQAERFFGNRMAASADKWMPEPEFTRQARPKIKVPKGELITVGFDGSEGSRGEGTRVPDSTVLWGCRVSDGHLWPLGIWEADGDTGWEPARTEVGARVDWTFGFYRVLLMYGDPPGWQTDLGDWATRHGRDRVLEWWTNRDKQMAHALERLKTDVLTQRVTHNGNERGTKHFLNAYRLVKQGSAADGRPDRRLILVRKKHRNSPDKIDSVPAAALAYEARADAIARGLHEQDAVPEYADLYY